MNTEYDQLVEWSKTSFHHLPWRKNRTLYGTLVSEIMLQQTTVSTVVNHFEKFLIEYPTPYDVARASDEQLTISWKGLGYYRRARNLKKACEAICENHGGEIPLDYDELVNIPGIGAYTANAIMSIGADKPVLAIDANLERVIARLYCLSSLKGVPLHKEINAKFIEKNICNEIIEIGGRTFNEALMDIGRTYCKANKASCELCPLRRTCLSFKRGESKNFPKLPEKQKTKMFELKLLRLIVREGDKIYCYQKKSNEWLSGQWELPTFSLECNDINLKQYPKLNGLPFDFELLPEIKTSITKYKITNKILMLSKAEWKKLSIDHTHFNMVAKDEVKNKLSTASIKCLDFIG